jgi:arylsulfatase A-like enzyme
MNQRPNIVYLHGHDIGQHVGPLGFAVHTPNIQRLANDGVLFRNAHTAGPTCSTSRAALLTGQSPHNAGMLGLNHRGFGLYDPSQHLATTLSRGGYETVIAGFQHVVQGDPAVLGYTTVLDRSDHHADAVMRSAVSWLEGYVTGDDDRPFFLDAGTFEAHREFPELPAEAGRYVQPLPGLPDAPATRIDTARFEAGIADFDRGVGQVLDAIDRLGLAESTIVICTTDHGPPFPRMKCNLTFAGTAVMLVMRGPAPWAGGKVVDQLVSNIDIYPTICDVAGIERPVWLQGVSIEPLAADPSTAVRDAHFAEITYHAAYEPVRAIRTAHWTLIRRFDDYPHPVLPNCDEGESKTYLLEHGWEHTYLAPVQLYDNALDPLNQTNIIDDPQHASVAADLLARLDAWMIETDDPLRDGPVRLPVGGLTAPVDGRTPEGGLLQVAEDGSFVPYTQVLAQF